MLYCTHNGGHLDLLIRTGSTQKEKILSQTIIRTF